MRGLDINDGLRVYGLYIKVEGDRRLTNVLILLQRFLGLLETLAGNGVLVFLLVHASEADDTQKLLPAKRSQQRLRDHERQGQPCRDSSRRRTAGVVDSLHAEV